MPHLILHAVEADLAGREPELIAALTDAIVRVYGEWARGSASVQLIGLPPTRWAIGGRPAQHATSVTFGIRATALSRPDADQIVKGLFTSITDAVASVFGEDARQ